METILRRIEELALSHDRVPPELIEKYNIKLGLRNPDGTGVVAGITSKGLVIGYEKFELPNGSAEVRAVDGKLLYCGYDVIELVRSIYAEGRFGFDEATYLLLTGILPNKRDLDSFSRALAKRRDLRKLERSLLMNEVHNEKQMYALHSIISNLSLMDKYSDSTSIRDVSQQCINLIAKVPTVVAYNHNVIKFKRGRSLNIIKPDPELSTAENFLYMLRGERAEPEEASIFDLCLILHAEHGGGNNSTFTVRTVSSSGANTYMAICSGIASLSGHLHGGANEAVMKMMKDIMSNVRDPEDDDEIESYLLKILDGRASDRSGKIYGLGHAVYTLSDPRAIILKEKAEHLAMIKGSTEEFRLFDRVERLSRKTLKEKKGRILCANVDFYSGFVYKMLGIPIDLFTPIFAMARVVGWSAHRIEQLIQAKIIRPDFISSVADEKKYVPIHERE